MRHENKRYDVATLQILLTLFYTRPCFCLLLLSHLTFILFLKSSAAALLFFLTFPPFFSFFIFPPFLRYFFPVQLRQYQDDIFFFSLFYLLFFVSSCLLATPLMFGTRGNGDKKGPVCLPGPWVERLLRFSPALYSSNKLSLFAVGCCATKLI